MRIPFVRYAASQIRLFLAPSLHRWMMHRASKPMELTDAPALIVAPHPDDETFACGGLIALKRRRGVPVSVVFLTDGRGARTELDPLALTRLRQGEALQALNVLGVAIDDVHFLDYLDGGLSDLRSDRRGALIDQLKTLLLRYRPGEIYAPHATDRHPDHEAANALARDAILSSGMAARLLQYPVWLIWWGPLSLFVRRGPLRGFGRLSIEAAREQKDRAIAVYRSQLPTMPRGFMGQFTQGFELFLAADQTP